MQHLQNRVFRTSRSTTGPVRERPHEYGTRDTGKMEKACREVQEGTLPIRRAAEAYCIPKSTLSDHVTGRVKDGAHSGPSRYLSDEEEAEMVHFLVGSANVGYARTKKDVLAIVGRVAEAKGIAKGVVSNGWWESFRKRHPHLTLRTAEKLSYSRYVATNVTVINHYFDLLKVTLADNHLHDKPAQIFNCDETGLPLDQTPALVVAARGQKHPRAVTTGSKKQITVLACANAAGYALPPLVIFSRKALNPELTVGEIPGTMYGLSDSGWMDGEIFDNWFTHHFLAHAPPSRPLLQLLDGHSTHYNPSFIRRAAQEKVIVFCLPPNTTHLTQPLDKGVFGPLKIAWAEQCHKYMRLHPGKVVTQYEFMALFSKAWCRAMSSSNIFSAFRTTGVCPFNRQAVSIPEKQTFNPKCLAASTGLAFIPLYSPHGKSCRGRVDSGNLSDTDPVESPATSGLVDTARADDTVLENDTHISELGASYDSDVPVFSEEEHERFQTRLEEGFDIPTDYRYNLWLRMYSDQGELCDTESSGASTQPTNLLLNEQSHRSTLKKFLPPSPIIKKPQVPPKKTARVLTSSECIKEMEEKERLKRETQEAKERRKQEREMRKAEKSKGVMRPINSGKGQRKTNTTRPQPQTEGNPVRRPMTRVLEASSPTKAKASNEKCVLRQRGLGRGTTGNSENRQPDTEDIRPARPVRRCKQNIDVTNAPPVKLSTDTRMSSCQRGSCSHPRAYKWVQCQQCDAWWHIKCAEIPAKVSLKDYDFTCCL